MTGTNDMMPQLIAIHERLVFKWVRTFYLPLGDLHDGPRAAGIPAPTAPTIPLTAAPPQGTAAPPAHPSRSQPGDEPDVNRTDGPSFGRCKYMTARAWPASSHLKKPNRPNVLLYPPAVPPAHLGVLERVLDQLPDVRQHVLHAAQVGVHHRARGCEHLKLLYNAKCDIYNGGARLRGGHPCFPDPSPTPGQARSCGVCVWGGRWGKGRPHAAQVGVHHRARGCEPERDRRHGVRRGGAESGGGKEWS
jgi:hypothetical protein